MIMKTDSLNGCADRPLACDDSIARQVTIYVTSHCLNCAYAYEVAAFIRREFPQVAVRIIDLADAQEPAPAVVFATPTYLLDGRVWSLGNPSLQQVRETFQQPL